MAELRCYIQKCPAVLQETDTICPECHSPQILNQIYRIRGILGGGGFGCVYDAIDMHLNNRRCAIKEIIARPPMLSRQQIEQEVNLLSDNAGSLPFIPDIYAYWFDGPKHYIAMQYIDGQTISERRRLPWSPPEVLHFVREMLGHLTQMHALGVVHRDIKPDNIKHTTRRGYVLLDFGLATQRSGTVIQGATPDFAPIEQFYSQRPADSFTDARSDLYSLAATAYYLLTRAKPMRADMRAQGQPLEPLRHSQGIPVVLEKTLLWMLELSPEQRPASAQVALDHLDNPNGKNLALAVPPDQAEEEKETKYGQLPIPVANLQKAPPAGQEQQPDGPFRELWNPLDTPSAQNAYREQLAKPDQGRINDMAWSPDGQQLAVASALGLAIYDLRPQQEPHFERMRVPVASVAYTANGTALALATPSGIQLFHARERRWLSPLVSTPSDTARAMAGVAQGRLLAIITDAGVELWQAGDDTSIATLDEDAASRIIFSAGGERMALVTPDGIKLWEQHQGQLGPARMLPMPRALVGSLAFSRDGGILAVASEQEISIWRTSDRARITTLKGIADQPAEIALSPDGKAVAVAADGQVSLWRIQPQRLIRILGQDLSDIIRLEFTPDGESLAACSQAELWVWNAADGSERLRRHDHLESMHSVAFSPDSRRLAAMGGRVYVWNIHGESITRGPILEGRRDQQNSVAFDPSGQIVAAASDTGIRLWDVEADALLHELPDGTAQAQGVLFADAGRALLNIAADAIEWRDVGDGALLRALPYPPGGPYDVALAAGGRFLATFAGHTISIWRSDGSIRHQLTIGSEINSVALAPDGLRLAVATETDTQIWSIKDNESPHLIHRRLEPAQRVIFAPDGACLALLRDTIILLWQLDDGGSGQLLALTGHTEVVHDLAFAPDGRRLASAAQDGSVRLWRLGQSPIADPKPYLLEQDQPDTSFYVYIGSQKHPVRPNVSSADTPSQNYVSDKLQAHEQYEPSISPPHVHLTQTGHSAHQDRPSLQLHNHLLKPYEVFEDLIMHKDYERLWGAFAHAPIGRHLLTGYGSFGGTSLIKCAMEKARNELQQSGYNDGALLAIHFKVMQETRDNFKVEADTLTIGHPDIPEDFKNKAQWDLLRAYAGQAEAVSASEQIDLPLENSLGITFFNVSDSATRIASGKTKGYDFTQFVDDLNLLFNQREDDITLEQIVSKFIGSRNLSTRLIIIIDKVQYIETITRLIEFNLFKSKKTLLIVIAEKEDIDNWGESSFNLENMDFNEWYLPCLWGIDFDRLIVKVDSPQSIDFNEKVNIFRKYLEYKGRGSLGRIMSELRDYKNTNYRTGYGLVDVIGLCERAEVRHNAWMQELLELNWDVILGDLFGGRHQDRRVDRAKLGTYYIIDYISINTLFTEEDVLNKAFNIQITISSNRMVVIETVRNILRVLVQNSYLRLDGARYRLIWSKEQRQEPRRVPLLRRRRNSRLDNSKVHHYDSDEKSWVIQNKIDLPALRLLLTERFNEDELRNLCFDMGIDYDNLSAPNKVGKTRELVANFERHKRIAYFFEMCNKLRPDIDWQEACRIPDSDRA